MIYFPKTPFPQFPSILISILNSPLVEALVDTGVVWNSEQIYFSNCLGDNEGINKLKQDLNAIVLVDNYEENKEQVAIEQQPQIKNKSSLGQAIGGIFENVSSLIFGKSSDKNAHSLVNTKQPVDRELLEGSNIPQKQNLFSNAIPVDTKRIVDGSNNSKSSGIFRESPQVAEGRVFANKQEKSNPNFRRTKSNGGELFGYSKNSNKSEMSNIAQLNSKIDVLGAKKDESKPSLFGSHNSESESSKSGSLLLKFSKKLN